jgi:hypothetical protein
MQAWDMLGLVIVYRSPVPGGQDRRAPSLASLIPRSSAASSWLKPPASQQLITSRSFNSPGRCSVRRSVPPKRDTMHRTDHLLPGPVTPSAPYTVLLTRVAALCASGGPDLGILLEGVDRDDRPVENLMRDVGRDRPRKFVLRLVGDDAWWAWLGDGEPPLETS